MLQLCTEARKKKTSISRIVWIRIEEKTMLIYAVCICSMYDVHAIETLGIAGRHQIAGSQCDQ